MPSLVARPVASGNPAALRLFVCSSSGAAAQGTGCSREVREEPEVKEIISLFPPQPSRTWLHAPWKNDDLTSLTPCHFFPSWQFEKSTFSKQNGIPEASGARKSRTELSERKILLPKLSKYWLCKWRGWGNTPSAFRKFWGVYSRCDEFKYVQSTETPCH